MAIDFTLPQPANTFAAGPVSGSDAVPTMRKIQYLDFDPALRAAILSDVVCNLQGSPSLANQWLEFALTDDGDGAVLALTTGVLFSDRPPAFEFVSGYVPRASCLVPSSSGNVVLDIRFGSTGGVGGSSIFSTKITIEQGEYSSLTAASQPVLATTNHVDDEEMIIVCESAGTGVKGVKVRMFVRWL